VAGLAFDLLRDLEFHLAAGRRLLEAQAQIVAQVGAAVAHAPTAAAPAEAEQVAEHVAEHIAEVAEGMRILEASMAPEILHLRIDAGMAVLVVAGALVLVGQHFVGLGDLAEALGRRLIVRIAVRMILHGQLAVGALDRVQVRVLGHAQNFVIIALGCHLCPRYPFIP